MAQSHLTIGTATLGDLPLGPRERLLGLRSELLSVHADRYFTRSGVSRADVRRWMRPLAAAYLYVQREHAIARDLPLLAAVATGEAVLI